MGWGEDGVGRVGLGWGGIGWGGMGWGGMGWDRVRLDGVEVALGRALGGLQPRGGSRADHSAWRSACSGRVPLVHVPPHRV